VPRRASSISSVLAVAILALASLSAASSADARLPRDFFGVVPQTPLTKADTSRMRRGGIDVVRVPVTWHDVQRTARGGFDWSGVDQTVALLARSRLDMLPILYGTPRWLTHRESNLPTATARQRQAWVTFVRAAVERYGTRGSFWTEHGPGTVDPVPRNPVRLWQVWNEPNFFYFATRVSPSRYARLLKLSSQTIRRADGRAETILGGLFGNPKPRPPRGMDSDDFLDRLYGAGIKRSFDGIALHPYAADAGELRRLTEALRSVAVRNRDPGVDLYVTEMGWGSQRNPRRVSFEVGRREQARELRRAFTYLIRNQGRLNVKQVHWFSWKDARGICNFCDSVGLFRAGARFKPKPAWHTFVRFAR
jgi:hypothetical protein